MFLGIFMLTLGSPLLVCAADKEDESLYIHLGLISYSPEFILSKDLDYIIFKIKNNSGRTISEIFGWVYRYQGENEQNAKDLLLANNPHRGGTIVKNNPHRPGTIAYWRFPLIRTKAVLTEKDKFTLRVSPKGVFFSKIEPPPEPKSKQK